MSWVIKAKTKNPHGQTYDGFIASCSDCGVSSNFYGKGSAEKAGEQHKEICAFIMEAKEKAAMQMV